MYQYSCHDPACLLACLRGLVWWSWPKTDPPTRSEPDPSLCCSNAVDWGGRFRFPNQKGRGWGKSWSPIIYIWSICHRVTVCWQQQDSPADQGRTRMAEHFSRPTCQPQWGGSVSCSFPWGAMNQPPRWRMPMNYSGTCCIWSGLPGNVRSCFWGQ